MMMVQDKGHEPKEAKMNQGEKDTQPAPKSPAKVTERVVTEVDRWGDVRVVGGHKTYKLKQDPKEHAFAHLGEYPYTYIGYQYLTYQACPGAPIQVGGSCDHCMTGIKDAFRFRSADGKVFKVGNQCVAKAGDRGLKKAIDNDLKKIRRERKAKRDNERIEAAMALYEANKDYLATLPHPMDFTDRETGEALTFVDYVEYMKKCCGVSGMLRVAKGIIKRTEDRA
jgi:hypothetical protein